MRLWRNMAVGWLVLALVLFVILVARSPSYLIYDEIYYVPCVEVLQRDGLTIKFVRELTGAAGPLHPILQTIALPIIGIQPPGVRWMNVAFLFFLIAMVWLGARRLKAPEPILVGLCVAAMPMSFVTAGMALSEISAITFMAASVVCLLGLTESTSPKSNFIALGTFAGLLMGSAILGRQTLFAFAPVFPFFAFYFGRLRLAASIYFALSAAAVVFLFSVWKGMVPPNETDIPLGIVLVDHLFLGLGYAAVVCLIAAPGWFSWNLRAFALSAALGALLGGLFSRVNALPLRGLMEQKLPHAALLVLDKASGMMVAAFGMWFLFSMLRFLWTQRGSLTDLCLGWGALALLTPPIMTPFFSSRYVEAAVPLLLLTVRRDLRATPWFFLRAIAGSTLALASIWNYYHHG